MRSEIWGCNVKARGIGDFAKRKETVIGYGTSPMDAFKRALDKIIIFQQVPISKGHCYLIKGNSLYAPR